MDFRSVGLSLSQRLSVRLSLRSFGQWISYYFEVVMRGQWNPHWHVKLVVAGSSDIYALLVKFQQG
jgi:hypothetical protein